MATPSIHSSSCHRNWSARNACRLSSSKWTCLLEMSVLGPRQRGPTCLDSASRPYAPQRMGTSRDPRLRPEAEEAWAGESIWLLCHDRGLVQGPLPRPEASAGGRGGSGIEAGHHLCLGNKASKVMAQISLAGSSENRGVPFALRLAAPAVPLRPHLGAMAWWGHWLAGRS